MKQFIFLMFALIIGGHTFAQDSTLLSSYYKIKNALVNGDAHAAALGAQALVKTVQAMPGAPTATFKSSLLKDATPIAATKNIETQRTYFASLSAAMADLAQKVKLSRAPVYEDYCPMKKAYWLSADKAIQNPYFGSAMPTCGRVVATF